MTDPQLLRQFVQGHSQAAFSQIVSRHINFVYSVCRRETGDAALAEDVTQVVFLILAQKAVTLRIETSLSGWLFQTARFASKNARRREAYRKMQEQKAQEQAAPLGQGENTLWNQVEPHLNAALAALSAKDREAVLLRFADGLSFPELSAALGTSENAARMRVSRAVSRLRQSFAGAGITLSAAVLTGFLAERTVQAAPPASVALLTKVGGSGAAVSPQVSFHLQGAVKAMTLSKITLTAAVALAIAAAISVPFVTRAQNPAQNPKAVSAPATQPAPVSGSGQGVPASSAVLLALNKLQLSEPFTLKYTAVTKDISTPAMWGVQTDMLKHSYEVMAKNGDITQAVAEEQIRMIGAGKIAQSPPSQFDVTLSFDGNRLFYQKTEPGANLLTVIYDGKKTYSYETSAHSMTLYPELKFGQMSSCPIPGAGLPQMPLLQNSSALNTPQGLLIKGNVLSTGVGGKPIYYERGAIALDEDHGSKEVAAMTLFYFERNFPEERWEFQSHRQFQNLPIASAIRYTRYAPTENTPVDAPNTQPWLSEIITQYQLVSASDTPVDASQFDPVHLMAPGNQVYENTAQGFSSYLWKAGGGF